MYVKAVLAKNNGPISMQAELSRGLLVLLGMLILAIEMASDLVDPCNISDG